MAAKQSRAKVIDISVGAVMGPRQITQPPKQVLDEAITAIDKAKFTARRTRKRCLRCWLSLSG